MTDEENPLAQTKKGAITAAACAAAGSVVSFQSVATSSEVVNGVGSATAVYGPDFGRLALGAIAALLSLVGLQKLRTLTSLLEEAGSVPDEVTSGKRLYTAVFVGVLIVAAWLVYSGLPHTTTTPIR